ncbi:MAG: PorV/PorQ family protein [Gracilimonas sp.]|uniref:PorV/PorQ family protein n=1 Tax=Gracilimonas sp. TaxID=1974203 RepID=UPI00198AD584|nr:PorV/PorQ family protein [Gracilimonas sp.]MBD3615787.1 PorV/PorQ family protein [Gracilimonas sp.]
MKTGFFCFCLLLISNAICAQGSGFEVLGIAPTPYALSKAEATTAMFDGAASIYSNPALLTYNKTSTIDLGYSFWIADVTNIFGGINFKKERQAIAFSFYTSGADDYQQFNQPGQSNGTFSVQYISIAAAYAYDFTFLSLGGAIQYLNEEIYTYRANGYAFNFGLAAKFLNERFRAGASITNLGEMEKLNVNATPLPASMKIGTSADIVEITTPKNSNLPVLISAYADFVYPFQDTSDKDFADYTVPDYHFNLGLSLTVAEVLELNGGYKTQNNVRPVSFGAGFISDEIRFSYALIPFNTGYGTVHSIGIQYKF